MVHLIAVTGLVCSAILKKLSRKANNVKEQILSNELEEHSKYARFLLIFCFRIRFFVDFLVSFEYSTILIEPHFYLKEIDYGKCFLIRVILKQSKQLNKKHFSGCLNSAALP